MAELKQPLIGCASGQLRGIAQSLGESAFRGTQLSQWIYKKSCNDFDQMKDLPKEFRVQLAEKFCINPLQSVAHKISTDGVQKLLMHGGDSQVFEAVLLPYEDRVSCCLSSQVGCPMACTFCATGLGGFDRNLSTSEIVAQYLALQALSEKRIGHVVFMGMGEPLLNLKNLLPAINILHDEIGLSYRHITVSTVGLVPQIYELAELNLPIHLALSLHSPFNEIRDSLMPVNNKWPVEVVVKAMRDYQKKTGRKVTFEYLLISELNDTHDQADELARLVRGFPCIVNLIPFNYVDTERGFARPSRNRVQTFKKALADNGVVVTERIERGHDIAAACGQLAGQHKGKYGKGRGSLELPVSS